MTRITLDAGTIARLHEPNGVLEVCDEAGQTRGFYHPLSASNEHRSPYSREQLEEFRKQRTGRSLAEILRDLER